MLDGLRWASLGVLSLATCVNACASAPPQPSMFIGGVGGISTLSADAHAIVTTTSADVSLYKPENGPAVNVFAGMHITDYLSAQANYVWNRNTLSLVSSHSSDGSALFFEEQRRSTQHSVVGDALLYFRSRDSWARPYLSAGIGIVRLESSARMHAARRGNISTPPVSFTSTGPALRVAVGIDVGATVGWRFRYSFSETISGNAISARLVPPAQRNLANFQNLFGAIASF